MNPVEELKLREELDTNPSPVRELAIRESLVAAQPQVQEDNLQSAFRERGEQGRATLKAFDEDEIGMIQAGIQLVGKPVAGTALDVVGQVATDAITGVGEFLSVIIPDMVEKPAKKEIIKLWGALGDTEMVQDAADIVKGGVDYYKGWKKENPNAAKTLESVVNIGVLLAPVKGKPTAKPTILGKTATKVKGSATKSSTKARSEFIGKLIAPKKTVKVLEKEVARTAEEGIGIFRKNITQLSPAEKLMAKETAKIKGVLPSKSLQMNYNAITAENSKLAVQLEKDLAKGAPFDFIPKTTSINNIDKSITKLIAENPVIVGEVEKTAVKVATKAKELIARNKQTGSGLLKARKEFDSFIRNLKGDRVFESELDNALTISVREVRRSMNRTLAEHAPNVAVKNSLKRQNILYDTLDNIAPKAAAEANTRIGQIMQNAAQALPIRNKIIQEAALLTGVGGLAATARYAPAVTGAAAGYGVYRGIKGLVMSPKTRTALSAVLKATDRALLSSKKPSLIRQMRADRALIIDLLKTPTEEE